MKVNDLDTPQSFYFCDEDEIIREVIYLKTVENGFLFFNIDKEENFIATDLSLFARNLESCERRLFENRYKKLIFDKDIGEYYTPYLENLSELLSETSVSNTWSANYLLSKLLDLHHKNEKESEK